MDDGWVGGLERLTAAEGKMMEGLIKCYKYQLHPNILLTLEWIWLGQSYQ